MPSSYSTNLKIELQATGENSGTWGTITNTNLGTTLEQAIVGYGNPNFGSDANLTLSYTDDNAAQAARALVLNVTSTGSLTATREMVVPTIQKQYIVQNNTTGSQSITVKTSAGTGITVPNGRKAHLYVDGTNVIFMDDYVDINGGAIDGTPIGANSASTGAFTTLSSTGNTTIGSDASDTVTVNADVASNLIPSADDTYDLGASGSEWKDLYVDGTANIDSLVADTADINGGTLDNVQIGESVRSSGKFTTLDANGNVILGSDAADTVTVNADVASSLIPSADNTYDLGASGSEWKDLYVDGTAYVDDVSADALTVSSGSTLNGGVVVNELGADADTRIEGDTDANLFFVDASTDRIGIGTSSPQTKLAVETSGTQSVVSPVVTGQTAGVTYGGMYTVRDGAGDQRGLAWQTYTVNVGLGEKMRLDSSGNLGLGVTPSAWYTGYKAMEIGTTLGAYNFSTNSGLAFNAADDGNWKYRTTAYAGRYIFHTGSGYHAWLNAPSGTAGTAISFSQAMTLDASGNLGIGTTTPSSFLYNGLVVGGGTGNIGLTLFSNSTGIGSIAFADSSSGAARYAGHLRYLHSSNAFTFDTEDVERMRLNSTGLGIGTSSPATDLHIKNATDTQLLIESGTSSTGFILFGDADDLNVGSVSYNHSDNSMRFETSDSERMRLSSDGELIVGGTTAIQGGPAVTITGTGSGSVGGAAKLNLYRPDTGITTGRVFGDILFWGNDTTSNTPTAHARIKVLASGTHGAGDNPTDIAFETTPDGTETVAEAGRITQAGSYVLKGGTTTAAAGVGIIFPATQVASANANSLDDYEEGTWTPSVNAGSITGTSITYDGRYTKIGRVVHLFLHISASVNDLEVGSYVQFSGLPYTFVQTSSGSVTTEDPDLEATSGFCQAGSTVFTLGPCGSPGSTENLFCTVVGVV